MANFKGAVAAGHPETANAAQIILGEGGNAFDAVLAALCVACVAEPVLCSLGGGAFLLAHPVDAKPLVYDFFVHTPRRRRPEAEVDFYPILADFGATQQEFHIGMGSIATPGVIRGLFDAHRDLGRMPMRRIVEPACHVAQKGVALNKLQAYIFSVVGAIYQADPDCFRRFESSTHPGRLMAEGDVYRVPETAETLDALVHEGADLFYRGEIARRLVDDCAAKGGFLSMDDMAGYRVLKRAPLQVDLGANRLITNPLPSTGGVLIAFALKLLSDVELSNAGFGSADHLHILARVMELTNLARTESGLHEFGVDGAADELLGEDFIAAYKQSLRVHPPAPRGTTHVSVVDGDGNAAALSVSNGEGAGYVLPGTGIVLNNMLGEEDINPHGFHRWPTDRRMASMMAPSVLHRPDGRLIALGSGGSNRIRTAVLQVLLNILEFDMGLEDAISAPRIHFEDGGLNLEPGFNPENHQKLAERYSQSRYWQEKNLFFGGVHAVSYDPTTNRLDGAGDERRGGVSRVGS